MKHKKSNYRCLVAHIRYNDEGEETLESPCIKCENCGEWIRPEDMDDECILSKNEESKNGL